MAIMQLGRSVGEDHPPFIIAAVDCSGVEHIEEVLAAVDEAAHASCDGLKLTTVPWSWYPVLFDRAQARGLTLISSVGDERAVARLAELGVAAFEVFFDWADFDLVISAARTGKPLVLSVANASAPQLGEVVALALSEGAPSVALVQRVVGAELSSFDELARHGAVTGISHRAIDPVVVQAAVRRGARIVEVRIKPRRVSVLAQVVRDGEVAWAGLGMPALSFTSN